MANAKKKHEIEPSPAADRPTMIRSEIVRIAEQNDGHLSPEAVVEVARDPNNFLHELFTWDDTDAAHKYRCMQASALIRRVKIDIVRTDSATKTIEVKPVRAIQSVPLDRKKGGSSYLSVQDLAKDGVRRESLVRAALAELNGIRKRYRELNELGGVWTAIDAATS